MLTKDNAINFFVTNSELCLIIFHLRPFLLSQFYSSNLAADCLG